MKKINIVGAGLAGCEAALNFADAGWEVALYEMKPKKHSEAHKLSSFAELVCSNSFKSQLPTTGSGLLKEEMKLLGGKLLSIAEECSVPAGNALAVDREQFSLKVTDLITTHPNISVINEEYTKLTDELTIIATGPLSSDNIVDALHEYLPESNLYFFDAIAPIVEKESINFEVAYYKSRYDNGEADYINCPFTKEEYYNFVDALNEAEKHEAKEFENKYFDDIKFKFYENCTPIEELARRGKDTLRFGVLRPVGLEDPKTDRRPFAALQLRIENAGQNAYNLVGCQTMLKYGEQKQVFRLIPGLEKANFLRYGSIHRNTYLNAPQMLNKNISLKLKPNVFIAGQLSGVEGYVESIFIGLLVFQIINNGLETLPEETIAGQLWRHLNTEQKNFQPMNANFGLLPALEIRDKKKKKEAYAERSLLTLKAFLDGKLEQ
ncbi:MAG: methylenetetrahydrofolate--tRNA-(uracil(54)-C(5))-methyltransferase (FADH(2)-oxidizing) TrmFO [Candidatus Cloacimonadales bacterium]